MNWKEFTPRVTADAAGWVERFGQTKPTKPDSAKAAQLAAKDLGCDEDDWSHFEDQYIEVFENKVWRLQTKLPSNAKKESAARLIKPPVRTSILARVFAAFTQKRL